MERYGPYILATVAIVVLCMLTFKFLYPLLRQKNFSISRRDSFLLIVLGILVILALLITSIVTEGTFIW